MDLISGLSGLKTASDLATRIRESLASREVKLDEVLARIIEIQGLISDGRTALIDSQEQLLSKSRESASLESQVEELKRQLTKKQNGRIHDNAVWKVLDDGNEEGPYCPNCFELNRQFIQPRRMATNNGLTYFSCTEHKTEFGFRVPVTLCGESPMDRQEAARPSPKRTVDI